MTRSVASRDVPIERPIERPLRSYAFDPSRGRLLGNEMSVRIRNMDLCPGPVVLPNGRHDRVAVVDYDASANRFYQPVNLDDPNILMQGGLAPSESDPRFHQQMVYAVVSETIEHFETALGRRIHWRRGERQPGEEHGRHEDDILTLQLYPHAMCAANAFYSPDAHGILFGYFRADRDDPGKNIPRQPVFTCLSHDIIVHETTHAIVDGLRAHFIEQTNVDVPAFHEAFADLAALFRHFTHEEVLLDTIQRTGGRLYAYQLEPDATTDAVASPGRARGAAAAASFAASALRESGQAPAGPMFGAQLPERNPLIELAQQFGEASGLRRGLRSALGTPPTQDAIRREAEPHARGSILVAAVFDAFFSTYVKRTSDLFRLFRAGGGSAEAVELPAALAQLLSASAMASADQFFRMCVRAIDYCPPVDITFGDFLRAVITADVDHASDPEVRDAWMQAFRMRGIYPDGATFFSEDALQWPRGVDLDLPEVDGLEFGDPNALTNASRDAMGEALRAYASRRDVRQRLGFDGRSPVTVPSFHPVFRVGPDGSIVTEMVVEVVQTRFERAGRGVRIPFRSGYTLILAHSRDSGGEGHARVRFAIGKPGSGRRGKERLDRQVAHAESLGLLEAKSANDLRIDFALVHGGL
jgi:hypothetical protein